MTEPIYDWNEETKTTTCKIIDDAGRVFIGEARCHPEDLDFGNRFAGERIAAARAAMKYLKSVKRDVLIPGLKALKQLYYSINQSNQFNEKSYEVMMLRRQINMKNNDIIAVNNELATLKQELDLYLKTKDAFYEKVRKFRAPTSSSLDKTE